MNKDFGAFEIREKIGSGGMASVYLGVQKSLDRQVVLKVLYPHLAEDEKLVVRFEREARAAAMMRHENIVQVIDCGRFEDLSYIAMEFVAGLDLKKWIESHGTPPVEMALLMLRDICRGIEHAHSHRLVHRDIKPANIMLTPDGTIKIMDFGLARRGEESTTVTAAGSVLGTPAYMSPEQATGETVDERSDIFSTGVVGYELLGGTRPFQGDSYSTVLRSILTIEPPPLEDLNPLVPEEVVGFIHKCLQKDVARRYQRIEVLRGDLETVVEQLGLHRGKDLLREYAQDPKRVSEVFRKKRLSRHLDQGLYFENMGLGKIDDALREFRRVLYLDPANDVARDHVQKLEQERERLKATRAAEPSPDSTLVLEPRSASPMSAAASPSTSEPKPAAVAPAATGPLRRAGDATARSQPEKPQPAPKRPAASSAQRTRVLLFAAVGVLVALVVVGLIAFFKPRPVPPPSPSPAPPPVSASPAPPTGSAPAPSTPTTKPELPPVTTASLRVRTNPTGARITVNGQAQAERSNTVLERLPPGKRTVTVEKQGFVSQTRQVDLAAGTQGEVFVTLKPVATSSEGSGAGAPTTPANDGTLLIRVEPYASVYVNGELRTENRISANIPLRPGRYTIRAVHPKFEAKEWTKVLIEPDKATTLNWNFQTSSVGSLRVVLIGGWARVFVDGIENGKTAPCMIDNVPAGKHTIELRRDGFQIDGSPQSIVVKAGTTVEAAFQLKQNP